MMSCFFFSSSSTITSTTGVSRHHGDGDDDDFGASSSSSSSSSANGGVGGSRSRKVSSSLLLLLLPLFVVGANVVVVEGKKVKGDIEVDMDMKEKESEETAVGEDFARAMKKEKKMDEEMKVKPDDIQTEGPFGGYCTYGNTQCTNENRKYDSTTRIGLGENVGYPGVAFLGLGYNIFEGNPRGTETSELDPGFRKRVIELTQDQNRNTVDQQFLRPYGVDILEGFTCKFSSKSTELSNEVDYQSSLSTEASMSTTSSVSGAFAVKGIPIEGSAKNAFTSSEKFESFRQMSSLTQTISYEAKAQCTEAEIFFLPYTPQTLDTSIQLGIDTLSGDDKFDPNNEDHISRYSKFIYEFGTHVVTRVALGGKHVVTSMIESKDVMDLKRDKIDVSTSLSFEASVGIGSGTSDATQEALKSANSDDDDGDDDKNTYTIIVLDKAPEEEPSIPCKLPNGSPNPLATDKSCQKPKSVQGLGFSASFGYKSDRSTSSTTETLSKIQSKIQTQTEVTIGGTPPEDGNWRTWAASVRERPMPIKYELTGLWEYMEPKVANNFIQAFFWMYGIDLLAGEVKNPVRDQLRFGIFDPEGIAITSYSTSSFSNFRSIVQAEQFTPERPTSKDVVLFEGQAPDAYGLDAIKKCDIDYLACGVKLRYDSNYGSGDSWEGEGVFEMYLKCCHVNDWFLKGGASIVGVDSNRRADSTFYDYAEADCDTGQYIMGGEVKYNTAADELGVAGFRIKCLPLIQDENVEPVEKMVLSGIQNDGEVETWKGGKTEKNSKGKYMFVVGAGAAYTTAKSYGDSEGYGIDGVAFRFTEVREFGGVDHDLYQYTYVWEGSRSFISAFFATTIRSNIAPNQDEENKELGISNALLRGDTTPFGLISTQDPQQARVVYYDFQDTLYTTDLNVMSLLAADNNPLQGVTAGVIHPRAYVVNKIFGQESGFKIRQEDDQTFVIDFVPVSKKGPRKINELSRPPSPTGAPTQSSMPSAMPSPYPSSTPSSSPTDRPTNEYGGVFVRPRTFVVFPLWFSTTRLPEHLGEVVVATSELCTDKSCKVSVGTSNSATAVDSNLGFAFLSFEESLKVPGVIHGTVSVSFDDATKTFRAKKVAGNGFTINPNRNFYACNPDLDCIDPTTDLYNSEDLNNRTVSRGGVEIIFDEEFVDLPSVIVSPILNSPPPDAENCEGPCNRNKPEPKMMQYFKFNNKPDAFRLPTGITESVSTTRTFVKVGWVNEAEDCPREEVDIGGLIKIDLGYVRCATYGEDLQSCEDYLETTYPCSPTMAPSVGGEGGTEPTPAPKTCFPDPKRGGVTSCNATTYPEEVGEYYKYVEKRYNETKGNKATTFEPLSFSFVIVGPTSNNPLGV